MGYLKRIEHSVRSSEDQDKYKYTRNNSMCKFLQAIEAKTAWQQQRQDLGRRVVKFVGQWGKEHGLRGKVSKTKTELSLSKPLTADPFTSFKQTHRKEGYKEVLIPEKDRKWEKRAKRDYDVVTLIVRADNQQVNIEIIGPKIPLSRDALKRGRHWLDPTVRHYQDTLGPKRYGDSDPSSVIEQALNKALKQLDVVHQKIDESVRSGDRNKTPSKINPQRHDAFLDAIEQEADERPEILETRRDPKVAHSWAVRTADFIYILNEREGGKFHVIDTIDADELKPGETLRSPRIWGEPKFF